MTYGDQGLELDIGTVVRHKLHAFDLATIVDDEPIKA